MKNEKSSETSRSVPRGSDLLPELVDCVREDLAAQRRILDLVERQRRRITDDRGRGLEQEAEEMVSELRSAPERSARRELLMTRFARAWELPVGEVTLSMIVLRLGERASELAELRGELRRTTAEVVRSLRRFSALVSTQRRVVNDVLRSLLDDEEPGRSDRPEGVLLDAEA